MPADGEDDNTDNALLMPVEGGEGNTDIIYHHHYYRHRCRLERSN